VTFPQGSVPITEDDLTATLRAAGVSDDENLDALTQRVTALEATTSGLSTDEVAAIEGAAAPTGDNVFATMADVGAAGVFSADESAAIEGAATPSADNVFATMADLPTVSVAANVDPASETFAADLITALIDAGLMAAS